MSNNPPPVAIFGLGEAGSLISADLARQGIEVRGFDPADVATPPGVRRCHRPRDAIDGATVVLALTASSDAETALGQALHDMAPDTVYADLSSASPGLKRVLARRADSARLLFADVALMSIVARKGLGTPALASGAGADRLVDFLQPLGMPIETVGSEAGTAATRKLLRSVFTKGLAALMIECMQAAAAAGLADETWGNVAGQLAAADPAFGRRLVEGTARHAGRRLHEMEAAEDLLAELGVDAVMTRSTVQSLRRALVEGVPALPPQP